MRKITRRSFLRVTGAAAALSTLAGMLTACGTQNAPSDTAQSGAGEAASGAASTATNGAADVVNIGSTGTLGSINPLMVDATWINTYAAALQFSPLVMMGADSHFVGMLAESIETEDNLTYTVRLAADAKWSDGSPITSSDLKFTMKCLTSPKLGNATMMLSALVGTDDNTGYRAEGVEDIEGVQLVDDKTCTFAFKYPLSPNVFKNGYAQYIYPMPESALKDVPEEELSTSAWFNAPTLISGPYRCTGYDANHYVSYDANPDYWMGAPKIAHLNLRIVAAAQLLSGLQSGEIDVVPPLLGSINQNDYDSVLALSNVDAAYGSRYAVESVFINCNAIPEKEVRQALLYGLDRTTIVNGLLGGQADLCDGFAVPAGPYDSGLAPTAFDAAKAAELLETAKKNGWDASKEYTLYLNSGDDTLIDAATVAQSYWQALGVNVKLSTVDLDALMTMCVNGEGDMYGVQYTYPPIDPSWDISWVLPAWCFYESDVVNTNVAKLWEAVDDAEYGEILAEIDRDVQENVPLIDFYAAGPLGAVAKRMKNVSADLYGCLINVHEWEITA